MTNNSLSEVAAILKRAKSVAVLCGRVVDYLQPVISICRRNSVKLRLFFTSQQI